MADILHIIGDKNLLKFLCKLSEEKNSYNMIFFILTIRHYKLFNIFNESSLRMNIMHYQHLMIKAMNASI